MSQLKELRIEKGMTQKVASALLGLSLRSYITYENDESKINTRKYRSLVRELEEQTRLDEEHGILSVDMIQKTCRDTLSKYDVSYAFLFGSYAKGAATEHSDVDILISTKVSGLRFYEITEALREALHKRVDLLEVQQLSDNRVLIDEVLKYGVRIYG